MTQSRLLDEAVWSAVLNSEFVPFACVVAIKEVSSDARAAARYALTQGRWKPVKACCDVVRDACSIKGREEFWNRWGSRFVVSSTDLDVLPTHAPLLRKAWACEPKAIAEYVVTHVPESLLFFGCVEPVMTVDAVGRIVASMERLDDDLFREELIDWAELVPFDGPKCGNCQLNAMTDNSAEAVCHCKQECLLMGLLRDLEKWDVTRAGKLLTGTIMDARWIEFLGMRFPRGRGDSLDWFRTLVKEWKDVGKRRAMSAILREHCRFAFLRMNFEVYEFAFPSLVF
jgi:hypothetical protein